MDREIMREKIQTPTLILNEKQAKKNLAIMAEKASKQHIRFRPHFKTHQSGQIGEWFRDAGVGQITVSSVAMAEYFQKKGWNDILIAFPTNLREIEKIETIAHKGKIGLLVDAAESVKALGSSLTSATDVWIKIDSGMKRAGIRWDDWDTIRAVVELVLNYPRLHLQGILTHAGQTYHAQSRTQILELYRESNTRMSRLKEKFANKDVRELEISVGDTPGCWLSEDLGQVDEIRPGNFLFFDAMMLELGVCSSDEIAVCVACPVVSKYPQRQEVVIYGGAVHLSKEMIKQGFNPIYGYAVLSEDASEWNVNPQNYVRSLSQEHGVVKLDEGSFNQVEISDLLYIVPVHSCLVVEALHRYQTFNGRTIETRFSELIKNR